MRGVTPLRLYPEVTAQFLLTRLMRGVTIHFPLPNFFIFISTHTPHARRDVLHNLHKRPYLYFYSHASCEA